MKINPLYIIGGGALLFIAMAATGTGKAVGKTIGGGAVDLVDGVVSGAVVGTGEVFGIPATNVSQCQADMAAGKTWAASFSCPAKTFIKYIFGGATA